MYISMYSYDLISEKCSASTRYYGFYPGNQRQNLRAIRILILFCISCFVFSLSILFLNSLSFLRLYFAYK